MPSKTSLIFLTSGLLIGITTGITLSSIKKVSPENVHEIRNSENFKYINPLLDCDSNSFSTNKNLISLKTSLTNIIEQQTSFNNISFTSIYYRDLNNGPWIGIHEKELFSPASLIKVPLMITYYKLAESDPSILEKTLINTKEYDPKEQNIVPTESLKIDQNYTVDDLIRRMIIYSDNLAYELLLENIDNNQIFKVYSDLGVDISQANLDPNGNIVSVKDYASFFRILFNSSYLNKTMSEKALELLSQVQYNKAITAGIPSGYKVSHKFGERQYLNTGEKQLHDCGIVYIPKTPYLLCVMTRGNDLNKLTNTIKLISQTVFNQTIQD